MTFLFFNQREEYIIQKGVGCIMTHKAIDLDTQVTRNQDVLSSELDNEVVMINIHTGKYYSLDPVGASIWKLLEKPVAVKSVVDELLEQYDVQVDTCIQETILCLNKLQETELVHIV